MSSQPGSDLYRPQTIDLPITGNTDASGNFSKTVTLRQAYWCVGKVVAQASGAPRWTVFKAGSSIPVDFGIGPASSIGPFVVAPNQTITLQVQGALPNTAILAQFTGIQSANQADVVDHFYPLSSGQVLQPIPLIILVADGAFHSMVNVPIPTGTHSIILSSGLANSNFLNSIQILGHTTRINYLTASSSSTIFDTTANEFGFLFSAYDTSLDITWQINALGTPIYVSGQMDPTVVTLDPGAVVTIAGNTAVAINSFLEQDGLGGFTSGSQNFTTGGNPFGLGNPYYNGLLVTEFGSKPAPWQAPLTRPLRIAGSFPTTQATATELIAAVAGKAIYIFDISLNCDVAVAGQAVHFVDAAHGAPAGGTIIGDISASTAGQFGRLGGGGSGSPLTTGNSLYIWQDNAGSISRGSITYSQA